MKLEQFFVFLVVAELLFDVDRGRLLVNVEGQLDILILELLLLDASFCLHKLRVLVFNPLWILKLLMLTVQAFRRGSNLLNIEID